ncbi:MAG: hypothetical protein K5851_08070 [Lachnospiraceae bacterium]|nr:hypothetical protein [Lachnospiraceae bacterium]
MKIKMETLAEFYSVSNDSFTVGRCIQANDNYFLLETLDSQGKWNGYYWFSKSMVDSIEYNTAYLKKVSIYEECWKQDNYMKPKLSRECFKAFDATSILEMAIEKKMVITVFTKEDREFNVGFLRKEGKKYKLNCISLEDANSLGDFSFKADEVVFIEIDSPDNNLLGYAYERTNGKKR